MGEINITREDMIIIMSYLKAPIPSTWPAKFWGADRGMIGRLIREGQERGEIASQETGGNIFKYSSEEDLKPRTLTDLDITAKQRAAAKMLGVK